MGREIRETHEHYDADGVLTGTTVVTRESEWDDEQRQIMLDWHDHQRLTAPCGHHPAVGMREGVDRIMGHQKRPVCLDCEAIEKTYVAFHKGNGHAGEWRGCERCDAEQFYVDDHVPLDGA